MLAFSSVLIATIHSELFIPAANWTDPDTPQVMISFGRTVRPLSPTCFLVSIQPARTVSSLKQAIGTVPLIIKSKSVPDGGLNSCSGGHHGRRRISGQKFPDNQADAYLLLKFDGLQTEEIEKTIRGSRICLEQERMM